MNFKPLEYYALYDEEQERLEHRESRTVLDEGSSVFAVIIAVALTVIIALVIAITLRSYAYTNTQISGNGCYIADRFENDVTDLKSKALDGIFEMKKSYVIAEKDIVMPTPNEQCYGVATSRDEMESVYASAEAYGLVKAEDSLFLNDAEWNKGSEVKYYLDETILSVCWKSTVDGQTYNFSEVAIAHPSQLRRYLTGDTFGSVSRDTTSAISKAVNAVVGMSGDFYAYRDYGVVVYRKKLYRCRPVNMETCLVDTDGNFHIIGKDELKKEEYEQYIADNNINFSLCFGPSLVKNGERVKWGSAYPVGEIFDYYARAAIAQVAENELHYLCCTVDGSVSHVDGATVEEVSQRLYKMGVYNAYVLDGGQTATIYFNGKVFNRVGYGSERPISDIIYFATAIPEE